LSFSDLNSTGIQARVRRIFPVVLFFGLSFGVPAVSQETAANDYPGNNLRLEWESAVPGRVVKVVNGKSERISFRIWIGENVSQVKFGISRKDRSLGITISPEDAVVHEGIASSVAEFTIPRGMPLGRHDLVIRVMEIGTDRMIGAGILPFILLPSGLECMC